MTTITEDYVSDETFKLLKEKGFDDSCCRFVIESDETYHRGAPTLQMVCKWLRQIHNIHITISLASDSYYKYEIHRLYSNYPIELKLSEEVEEYYNQYEEACETAIKYCLENLI